MDINNSKSKVSSAEYQRERARLKQKRYRDRKKSYVTGLTRATDILSTKTNRLSLYLALLTKTTLLGPNESFQLRSVMIDLYCDYFEFGANSADPREMAKQQSFLKFYFMPSCVWDHMLYYGITDQLVFYQWLLYSGLYDHLHFQKTRVQHMTDHATFRLVFLLSISVTHRSIVALYPHMLSDGEFMQRVIGKELKIQCTRVLRFNTSRNRIEYGVFEHSIAAAWCHLLGDAKLVAKLMRDCQIDEYGYIIQDGTNSHRI